MEVLNAILAFVCAKIFRRPRSSEDQVNSLYVVPPCELTEVDVHSSSLSTWPIEQLEQTLKNILVVNWTEMGNEEFDRLLRAISEELDDTCPFKWDEQYDFCIICASDDYDEALKFLKYIESRLELIGYMVSEAVSLGRDHFEAYEDVVERSSKVIFYITKNFSDDGVCCHLARNTFVAPNEQTKNKCIPIVDDLSTRLPDSMMLVEKLVKSNSYHIDLRLRNVFNDSVRQEKKTRVTNLQKTLDTARLELLKRMLVDRNFN